MGRISLNAAVTYILGKRRTAPDGPKRLCEGCFRLYSPGDISHNLKGMACVCVGCADKEHVSNPGIDPDGEDYSPRYSGVL